MNHESNKQVTAKVLCYISTVSIIIIVLIKRLVSFIIRVLKRDSFSTGMFDVFFK
jgi:hypothetical protein